MRMLKGVLGEKLLSRVVRSEVMMCESNDERESDKLKSLPVATQGKVT